MSYFIDMKQRGIFSITTLILLRLEERPLTKTRLMQDLLLNYERTNRYCVELERRGLIEYDYKSHKYALSPSGLRVLKLNEELAGFLRPVDKIIKRYSEYIQRDICKNIESNCGPIMTNNKFLYANSQ